MTWHHPLMDFTQDSEEESPRNRYSSSATLTTLHYMRPAARLRRGGLAWVENAHGITPAAFCFIKHLVGLSHQQTKLRQISSRASGYSKTRRHAHALALKRKRKRCELLPEAGHGCLNLVGFDVRHHQ